MSSIAPIRRGRGRGGFVRGRGRGRGRSIRSTHRSRTSKPSSSTLSTTPPSKSFADIVKASMTTLSSSTETVIHTWSSVRALILSDAVVQLHVDACQALPDIYKEHLQHILDRNIYTGMSATVRARIFATMLHCKERDMCHTLLQHPNFLGLAEVVRAVQLLDANRVIRALQGRYTRLEFSKINPVKPSTLTNIKTKITNAQQETVRGGSISGARQKILKRWTRSIPANKLIFYLLTFPPDLWKQLADIAHLSPADFQLPYFLPVVFGAKPPHDSVVAQAQAVTYDNFADTLKNVPELTECYSYFRQKFKDGRAARTAYENSIKELTDMGFTEHQAMLARKLAPGGTRDTQSCVDWILERQDALDGMRVDYVHKEDIPSEAKALFGRYGPLEEILWYYEELACPSVEEAIYQRLLAGEQLNIHSPRANYGKLMERLLLCMDRGVKFAPLLLSYAEARLKSLTIPTTNTTVAVMGDASGSMEIAIRCASSLGSLLSATLSADLVFFNDVCFNPSVVPRTAAEALQVIQETHAGNGTSMAAALNRFYAEQIRVDLFVLVSDEEENVDCNGMNFTTMFQQYLATVNPQAKLILVSFIPPGAPGYIGKQLQDVGIEYIEFRLDKQRPDTTKFDQLLGLLSLETSAIAYRRQVIQQALQMLPTPVQEIVQHY